MLELIIKGREMMVPLLICSMLALAVIIDRGWAFYKHRRIDSRALRAKVLELLAAGRIDDAMLLCASTPGPVSAVVLTGLQTYVKHNALNNRPESIAALMEKAMDDYALHAISAVEKRFGVLSTVGTAAPLLGMTGTVTGMIRSFESMASAGVDNSGVALGISEALITTAAGLIIALFAVVPYNYFTSLADKMDLEVEESTSELIDFVATRMETAQRAQTA